MSNVFVSIFNFFKSQEEKLIQNVITFVRNNKVLVETLIDYMKDKYEDNQGHEKMIQVVNIVLSFVKLSFLIATPLPDKLVHMIEGELQEIYDEMKASEKV